MTKAKISEYDAVAANNTDVNGVNIAENCPPSGMNNMGREIMAALKRFQVGSDSDGVTVGGNLVVSGTSTLSTTSISSADINAGTIDATAIGGSTPAAGSFTTLNTSGAVVFNDAGADVDFRVESDTNENALFVDGATGNVGVGATPSFSVDVVRSGGDAQLRLMSQATGTNGIIFRNNAAPTSGKGAILYPNGSAVGGDTMQFVVDNAERMRITSGGVVLVGATTDNADSPGIGFGSGGVTGLGYFCRNAGALLVLNRNTDDGTLVLFRQGGVDEGNISVSGNTVSYNPFLGSHSGALADWSKPEIKIGTVMDTIDELLEYKVVVIDVQEEVPAKEAVLDEEGNEVEPAQEATTQTVQKRISYNGNGAVGSTATVEYEGEEYTGTIQHEREEPLSFNKHLKVKINDTAASKAVFGVFVGWNNDKNNDGGVYNDMLVGAVGNYVIRMAAGQEPQIGDLVEADGNGCAVVQDDDIIRTKTIAKITSTIKQVTYDDGSFLVTCVLYCG